MQVNLQRRLDEKMSFDQLFRISDPKRVSRSFKVRGPPLDLDAYRDAVYYIFNFKANPSTTGLRHRGYIKFLRPKNPKRTPLQKLDCIVDCTCPDYKFRWAWANKQRGAGRVGAGSLNQSLNRAPKITNPVGMPGLCKHILATREYIYGLLSSFPGDQPDTAEKLDKLTRYASKRWANMPQLVAQAKEREAELQRQIAARRRTGKPLMPPEVEKIKLEPPRPAAPPKPPVPAAPPKPPAPTPALPPPRTKPRLGEPVKPGVPDKKPPVRPSQPPPKRKREESLRITTQSLQNTNLLVERVVNPNAELFMTTLTEAKSLVEELEDDVLQDYGASPVGLEEPSGGGMGLEPIEPPISDTAIGADTEADTALGLLRQMRDLLTQLVVAEVPAGEEELPGVGAGAAPGEEGGEFEMPPEPPSDEETPTEEAGEMVEPEEERGEREHAEGGSEEEEEKEREERPNRRPSED